MFRCEVSGALTGVRVRSGLAGELAQRAAVNNGGDAVRDALRARRQEALGHVPREAHRAAAVAFDA